MTNTQDNFEAFSATIGYARTETALADGPSEGRSAVNTRLTHLDLFSGIGGFALACRMVGGIKTVGFCEIDPWARRVLTKNFPGVPIHDDVKTLNPKNYGPIDLLTGGYPCQPFSLSGKRKGADDDRHLWPEIRRIADEGRPRWIVCENVIGHITLGLDEVLDDLASLGYTCAPPIVLPACAVGNWHRRDRVWIIAYDASQHLQKPEMVDSEEMLSKLRGTPDAPRIRVAKWEAYQPSMVGMAHGIPNWVDRARGTGNAIVPQIAAEIIATIAAIELNGAVAGPSQGRAGIQDQAAPRPNVGGQRRS